MKGARILNCFLISLLTLLLPAVTGCWDQRPLENLNIVFGLGVDVLEHSEGMIRLIADIPTFEREAKKDSQVIKREGFTLINGLQRMQEKVTGLLVLGHVKVLVFGEEMARKGLRSILDDLDRNPDFNSLAFIVVADGKAEDIFSIVPTENPRVSAHIEKVLTVNEEYTAVPKLRFEDFMCLLYNKYSHGFMPLIAPLEGEKLIGIIGLAVFKDDKMVGKYNMNETFGFMIASGRITEANYTIEKSDDGEGEKITVNIRGGQREIKVNHLGEIPEIELSYKIKTSYLREYNLPGKVFSEKKIKEIEEIISRDIQRLVTRVIRKQQEEFGSDTLEIGRFLAAHYPEYMKSVDWDTTFPKAKINVNVSVNLNRLGFHE
jgi:Ger(x)C family germination protein